MYKYHYDILMMCICSIRLDGACVSYENQTCVKFSHAAISKMYVYALRSVETPKLISLDEATSLHRNHKNAKNLEKHH